MLLWWWTGVLAGGTAAPIVFNAAWLDDELVISHPVPQPQQAR